MKLPQDKINKIFDLLSKNNLDPTTELNYHNNFTLLVAVVLSAQAKDAIVNIATQKLFEIVSSPQDMLKLGEEELIKHIKIIGLYKNKAKNIILLSKNLIDNFNSTVPNTFEDLISLEGVGRKTANVILNVAFNKPTMPVDTHVFRLAHRIGLSEGNNPLEVEKDLLQIIPQKHAINAHHLLILHGRYICKAKGFDCAKCILNDICLKRL